MLMREAPPLPQVEEYISRMNRAKNPFFLAAAGQQGEEIVAWCDIKRATTLALAHSGTLGMGVRRDFRRRGIGRAIAQAALEAAWAQGFERVELMVYCHNEAAIALYENLGFFHEGEARLYAKIDSRFLDAKRMAILHPTLAKKGQA